MLRRSILTEKVARRGNHLSREYRVDPFTLTRARDIMTTDMQTVPADMTLHQTAAFMTDPNTRHPSFPVIDEGRRVLGIVDPPAVLRWRRAGQHRSRTLADLLAGIRAVVAYPDEYLDGLVERMSEANGRAYPGYLARGRPARRIYRLEGPDERPVSPAGRGAGARGAIPGALTLIHRQSNAPWTGGDGHAAPPRTGVGQQ